VAAVLESEEDMDWSAIAIVIATFGGPIAAVQAQKYLERHRDKRRMKEAAFRTLMATRAFPNRTSAEHVQALNGIEITFANGSNKDRAVVEAWNAYRDVLNTPTSEDAQANARVFERRDDAFWDLLHVMSKAVGYPFDRTAIKNNAYIPILHGDIYRDQEVIRLGVAKLLSGNAYLKVIAYPPEVAPLAQQAPVQPEAGTARP
jgi:hypothetical protein